MSWWTNNRIPCRLNYDTEEEYEQAMEEYEEAESTAIDDYKEQYLMEKHMCG